MKILQHNKMMNMNDGKDQENERIENIII